ncbi:MAG: NFACT family protein [Acholeplasmataceae bacterium]|nr:NFACT family protein [Acholeplasmataceae bacterium]
MVFDGFFIYHLISELNRQLEKARLEKIYQTGEYSFVFVFYLRGQRLFMNLNLSSHNFGVYLTQTKSESTMSSQFLITLKKHLEGAILQSIVQHETDRVFIFKFVVHDFLDGQIQKNLIFEAMGKHSNLLLVQDNIILDTYKKMFFAEGRQLLPQAQFEFFPSDKLAFHQIDYSKVFSYQDIVNQYMGVSPFLARYLIDHRVQLSDIKVKPTRALDLKKDYVFDIFEDSTHKKYFSSISLMMDLDADQASQSISSHALFIEKQLKKYTNKKEQLITMQDQALLNLENKGKGDLIYQSGLPLDEKNSSIEVLGSTIHLDPTKTLNENAQTFYKAYQKAKRTLDHIKTQNRENEEMISLFEEYMTYLELSLGENIKDFESDLIQLGYKAKQKSPQKKQNKKPNILKLTDGDIHYYIGKNSLQNEYITHQIGKKDDYWFHVKDFPGSHVLVDTPKLNESIIRKASMLAAYFSSMKYSSSIPVDYTQIKYIKKISGKPGYHVTYKNQQTMYIDIDEKKIENYLKNV